VVYLIILSVAQTVYMLYLICGIAHFMNWPLLLTISVAESRLGYVTLGMWHAWERRQKCKVLVGKSEGKRPLGRTRCRWEDGIRMDLGGFCWRGGVMEQIQWAQDRGQWWAIVNAVMNPQVLVPRS
jgi:hypothetical protein